MRHLLLCVLPPASLGAKDTSWAAEADFNSRYIWRGIVYSKGPVLQPSFSVTHSGFTVSIWSNMVLNNEPGRGRFDQVFFSVSREFRLARWRLEPTLQGYTWQGLRGESTANTLELSAKISRPLGPVHFVTSGTVDIASFPGSFIGDAGIEWKHSAHRWRFESSATTAWANHVFNGTYIGLDRAAMNYLEFTLSATRKSVKGWYIRPHVESVTILNNSITRALGYRAVGNAGVAVGREF